MTSQFSKKLTNHTLSPWISWRKMQKRNKLVLAMTKNSGSVDMDAAVLRDTRDELAKGCGNKISWSLEQQFPGAFPLHKVTKSA
jgi:hypothetical protein